MLLCQLATNVTLTAETSNYFLTGTHPTQFDWVIRKGNHDMAHIKFDGGSFTFNGGMQFTAIEGTLPTGVSVLYTGGAGEAFNGMTNAVPVGTSITAKFTVADEVNYNKIDDRTVVSTMAAAEVTIVWSTNPIDDSFNFIFKF